MKKLTLLIVMALCYNINAQEALLNMPSIPENNANKAKGKGAIWRNSKIAPTTAENFPNNQNWWSILQTQFGDSRYHAQLAFGLNQQDVWLRYSTTDNWRKWKKLVTTDGNGNVGIGNTTPNVKLHVAEGKFGVKSRYSTAIIESSDSQLDIISSNEGTWGSTINLIEGNGSSNKDVWSISRQTTGSKGDSSLRFNFGTNNQPDNSNKVTFSSNGNVGIGTTSPTEKLYIREGNINVYGLNTSRYIRFTEGKLQGSFINYDGTKNVLNIGVHEAASDDIKHDKNSISIVRSTGNVGIGTTKPDTKLAVNGTIHTKEVKVDLNGWSDFVFENNYKLPTLIEVENHIKTKGHLQDIPSAKEVEKNGILLGNMNAKLLQKIEELTLYTIQQEKEIKQLNELKNTVQQQQEEITTLKKMLNNFVKQQKQ